MIESRTEYAKYRINAFNKVTYKTIPDYRYKSIKQR